MRVHAEVIKGGSEMKRYKIILVLVAALLYLVWPLDVMPGIAFDDVLVLIAAIIFSKPGQLAGLFRKDDEVDEIPKVEP